MKSVEQIEKQIENINLEMELLEKNPKANEQTLDTLRHERNVLRWVLRN